MQKIPFMEKIISKLEEKASLIWCNCEYRERNLYIKRLALINKFTRSLDIRSIYEMQFYFHRPGIRSKFFF